MDPILNTTRKSRPVIFIFTLILFGIGFLFLPTFAQNEESGHIKEDLLRNEAMLHALHFEEVLGPVGGIAVSPFFGITLTSGASLAAQGGMFPNNDFFRTNTLLGNWWVFGFFLILTLVAATFTFTGCEEKTGTTTYFRQDGNVTQVNRYRNSFTGETVYRSRRMSGQQYQSEQYGNQALGIGLAIGGALLEQCFSK